MRNGDIGLEASNHANTGIARDGDARLRRTAQRAFGLRGWAIKPARRKSCTQNDKSDEARQIRSPQPPRPKPTLTGPLPTLIPTPTPPLVLAPTLMLALFP